MMRMRMMGDVVGTLLPAMMKGSVSLNEQSSFDDGLVDFETFFRWGSSKCC